MDAVGELAAAQLEGAAALGEQLGRAAARAADAEADLGEAGVQDLALAVDGVSRHARVLEADGLVEVGVDGDADRDALARDQWLFHMRAAVDSLKLPPLQDGMLWDYLDRAAQAMVNTFEE